MSMPVKMVELDTWIDERGEGAVVEGFWPKDAQPAPAESSHLMELLLEALTDPGALAPLIENLTAWTAASDHLQTCAICRSGLATLTSVGDTPEGTFGALLAHTAQDSASVANAMMKPRRAAKTRATRKRLAPAPVAPIAPPAPDASTLASYVALVQVNGVATATTKLPAVARHLRGCPLCRRDVSDALAVLQSREFSAV
jgi:hypothetical protein